MAKLRSVASHASDVCTENFPHNAWLLRQQSRASFMRAIITPCAGSPYIESAITWKYGQCQNKCSFLYYRYRYFTRGIDASYRHTSYRLIVTPLTHTHACTHTQTDTHTLSLTHTHTLSLSYTNTHAHTHKDRHAHMHARYTRAQTQTHTRTHTHTHTNRRACTHAHARSVTS